MSEVPDLVIMLGPGVGLAIIGAVYWYYRAHHRDKDEPNA
jgi:hypothetical protein